MSQDLLKEVKRQNAEKVKQILISSRNGIDINFVDSKTKMGFLHIAIQNYDLETMNALLSDKNENNLIDLNIQLLNGLTPLAFAAQLGYFEGVELLLNQKNIDVNFPLNYDDNKTAFHAACANKNNQDILNILIKKGADPNVVSRELGTPLRIAIEEDDNEKAIWLINNPKVDIFAKDEKDNTCLHYAVIAGLGDFVNDFFLILSERIKEKSSTSEQIDSFLNIQNDLGNSILHQSLISNRISIMKLLKTTGIQLGLDIKLKNKQNKTAEELQVDKEEKKKQAEVQITQRKNEVKIEKAQIKEEKKRSEKKEKELEEQYAQEQESRVEQAIVHQNQNSKRTLLILLTVFIMLLMGVVLFFKARRNMQNDEPKRSDYDDFL